MGQGQPWVYRLAEEEKARLLGAGWGLRACQSGGLPGGGEETLLGKDGLSLEAPLDRPEGRGGAPQRSMAWPGPVSCPPSGSRRGGGEVHDLYSFPSWEGQGMRGVGLGNLVRDGGEGLVPQGRALIKPREGFTDRPSGRDRGGQ